MRTANQPIHRITAGILSRGVTTPVSCVYLLVWLTAPDPSGSTESMRLRRGCSHPAPATPGARLPPASSRRYDGKEMAVSHPHPGAPAPRGAQHGRIGDQRGVLGGLDLVEENSLPRAPRPGPHSPTVGVSRPHPADLVEITSLETQGNGSTSHGGRVDCTRRKEGLPANGRRCYSEQLLKSASAGSSQSIHLQICGYPKLRSRPLTCCFAADSSPA